jgi:Aspartyl/Asparaginyl beta-hydroxylase
MPLPDRVRLPMRFDPAGLVGDLERLRGVEWHRHFVRDNYEGDWSVIPLRAQAGAKHPVMMIYPAPDAEVFEDTPFLARMPYIQGLLRGFACELRCVRLMRLTAGSVIKEHRDLNLAVELGGIRLHAPITSNPDVDFRLNGTRVFMEPGSLWYLRLSDPHSVTNDGDAERVHLVIDAHPNPWLLTMLERGANPSYQM